MTPQTTGTPPNPPTGSPARTPAPTSATATPEPTAPAASAAEPGAADRRAGGRDPLLAAPQLRIDPSGADGSAPPGADVSHWYQDAVIYELHVRAFQDSNGDGIGDFRGLISRLDYLQDLGVTALWLLPFYPSPLRDDGYDTADYRSVHPSYGTLRDVRVLLREAHRRGLRVITELVLAHTSDQHPWFQRARRSPAGSRARDFYTWSDTAEEFADARVIFQDFETSNWAWDPVAGAYYWHRFYSHQPALNYDNPAVREAIFAVVDHWFEMGVDGLRLDAVPYLYAREGTTCENLPETLAFLRDLRRHIDERFVGKMLLAEANQWPEDAVAYFGDGDTCQMAFHFPLMPRMFMAAVQEDRFPIVDILNETPTIPEGCQWGLFLRNHDELTLEMVTDEERDYMYRTYATDPQARINVGIRRRLAPLLGNDRRLIEMMNGMLFSLPGTPIVYYGDEIGMGDNIYLGDRDAVRTPMQWTPDRNAGFSRANPQQLYLPLIIDPEYQPPAVNVESQLANASSLLWWMRRLISVRNAHHAFARGSFRNLRPDNRKVLAFLRVLGDEHLLVVVNLSRHAQAVQLDLSDHRNAVPVELFGQTDFPPVGDLPYFLTLGPYAFHWFALERRDSDAMPPRGVLHAKTQWTEVLEGRSLARIHALLRPYVQSQRWFRDKARGIRSVSIVDTVAVGGPAGPGDASGAATHPPPQVVMLRVELTEGSPETYVLPLTWSTGARSEDLDRFHPEAVVADLYIGGEPGVLHDAMWDPQFCRALLELAGRRRRVRGRTGQLTGNPTAGGRRMLSAVGPDVTPGVLPGDQSNTSVLFDEHVVMKLVRHVQRGTHPSVELGRFLAERVRFPHAPAFAGSIEHHLPDGRDSEPATIVTVEEFRANEGDGWSYVVDAVRHGLEQALARHEDGRPARGPLTGDRLLAHVDRAAPDDPLVAPHHEWASVLGERTAQMHLALAGSSTDPAFTPEALTAIDRQTMSQSARSLLRRTLRQARASEHRSDAVQQVLEAEPQIVAALRPITTSRVDTQRIRCHGDLHLGQVLWTGKDFVIIDFEGEPARSLSYRRLKRPALLDVAGMIRSFHYAACAAAIPLEREIATSSEPDALEPLVDLWFRSVSGIFLDAYLQAAGTAAFVPPADQIPLLLDFLLLDKAIYELGYELNSRPEWADIPARGILALLRGPA